MIKEWIISVKFEALFLCISYMNRGDNLCWLQLILCHFFDILKNFSSQSSVMMRRIRSSKSDSVIVTLILYIMNHSTFFTLYNHNLEWTVICMTHLINLLLLTWYLCLPTLITADPGLLYNAVLIRLDLKLADSVPLIVSMVLHCSDQIVECIILFSHYICRWWKPHVWCDWSLIIRFTESTITVIRSTGFTIIIIKTKLFIRFTTRPVDIIHGNACGGSHGGCGGRDREGCRLRGFGWLGRGVNESLWGVSVVRANI